MSRRCKYNWPELIKSFDASGLSQTEFCRQNNLNPKYFSLKRSKLLSPEGASFVKVEVAKPSVTTSRMISWDEGIDVYLHRDPVDFRKAINGLSLIVSEQMNLSPFDRAIFAFCNKRRTQLKVLYWDDTGFALWQKRLEKNKFKWPRKDQLEFPKISHEQWCWLLRGFDYSQIKPHQSIEIKAIC